MKMSYGLSGDDNAPVMNGIMIRCHTNKCTRVVTLRNFTEGHVRNMVDTRGKVYL